MRRAYNSSVWRNDSGQVIAVNLGADYCAEHEWGIKPLKESLGIRSFPDNERTISDKEIIKALEPYVSGKERKNLGLPMRKINSKEVSHRSYGRYELANNLDTKGVKIVNRDYKNKTKETYTMWGVHFRWLSPLNDSGYDWKEVCGAWYSKEAEETVSYWNDSSFAFFSEDKQLVKDIVEAFERSDVAVWTGSSGPFRNGGLIVAIASRLPEEFVKQMEESDLDTVLLRIAAAKENVRDILKDANKRYFALSPRWKDDNKKEVQFWLNPLEQNTYNYGWYSAKELRQWANNEGPVVIKTKK